MFGLKLGKLSSILQVAWVIYIKELNFHPFEVVSRGTQLQDSENLMLIFNVDYSGSSHLSNDEKAAVIFKSDPYHFWAPPIGLCGEHIGKVSEQSTKNTLVSLVHNWGDS